MMIAAIVVLGTFAGLVAGIATLILGHGPWIALAVYSGAGITAVLGLCLIAMVACRLRHQQDADPAMDRMAGPLNRTMMARR